MTSLAQLLIQETPAMIAFAKALWIQRHPDLPVPTSEEVLAIYEDGFRASVAKDDAILAANPE